MLLIKIDSIMHGYLLERVGLEKQQFLEYLLNLSIALALLKTLLTNRLLHLVVNVQPVKKLMQEGLLIMLRWMRQVIVVLLT